MKIILKEDIANLGKRWDIKKVAGGYARNFLIPKDLAIVASPSNLKMREEILRQESIKMERLRSHALSIVNKLQKLVFVIKKPAGEEGRLHGTVTAVEVADFLHTQGFDVDRKQVHINIPIKSLGEFEVDIAFTHEVVVPLKVKVEAEDVDT
jgi:large subunit ribosomal protein L9